MLDRPVLARSIAHSLLSANFLPRQLKVERGIRRKNLAFEIVPVTYLISDALKPFAGPTGQDGLLDGTARV
jgi:hypothetical protein